MKLPVTGAAGCLLNSFMQVMSQQFLRPFYGVSIVMRLLTILTS